ncbi:MAG: glycosyltransferase family 2 protein, partial [Oscillospiraceae bacterium]|nr:glycosyltransferase family 2 protein [Oscillospiraceae bacterium]
MKVLIIIPAYNEAETIVNVIKEIQKYRSFDIVVINDGSTDMTSCLARNMNVCVIDHAINKGIGAAMKTGFQYAAKNNYDVAVQVDADGQHDISMLKKLISKVFDEKYDMVIGSRYVSKTKYNSTKYRLIGIKYCSFLIYALSGHRIKDPTSGFRAFNRRVIDYCILHYIDDYPEVPILFQLIKQGYKIHEMPVEMKKRQGGKSSISFLDSIIYFI